MSIAATTPLPTLLFAAFAALAVTGCGIHIDVNDDTTRRIENDVVPAAGLTEVAVDTENGAVEVRSGPDDEISIRTVLEESHEGDAEYSIGTVGDRLVLTGECDSGWRDHCQVAFVVTVPAEFDVDVTTRNGRIAVTDVSGRLELETDNGAIEGEALRATTVEAHTDNGRVRLVFDVPPSSVDVETDNGAIAVRVPDRAGVYDIDASSDNGSVEVDVRTDPGSDRRITVRSDNGAIDVDYRTSS